MMIEVRRGRGSEYIGVTKNGPSWQVSMNTVALPKTYVCSVDSKELAAIINDIVSIQYLGKHAKLNYAYPKYLLKAVMDLPGML